MAKKSKLFSEEQKDYLLYYIFCKDEPNYKAAAEHLGVTTKQITDWRRDEMKRRNEKLDSVQPDYTDREIRIIKQYYPYKTAEEIGRWIGRSGDAVCKKASSLNITKKVRTLKKYDNEIRKLSSEGLYIQEIAMKLGLKYESVRSYCARNGIAYRRMPYKERDGWHKIYKRKA